MITIIFLGFNRYCIGKDLALAGLFMTLQSIVDFAGPFGLKCVLEYVNMHFLLKKSLIFFQIPGDG